MEKYLDRPDRQRQLRIPKRLTQARIGLKYLSKIHELSQFSWKYLEDGTISLSKKRITQDQRDHMTRFLYNIWPFVPMEFAL